ncbi:MAG: hypothetical protein ONB55_19355 [candidate division KSB1 bacterium]|nr:hypothetical protein [candidate division KSB1 bacterium]
MADHKKTVTAKIFEPRNPQEHRGKPAVLFDFCDADACCLAIAAEKLLVHCYVNFCSPGPRGLLLKEQKFIFEQPPTSYSVHSQGKFLLSMQA